MPKFLISTAVADERVPTFEPASHVLGKAHYSWKIVSGFYKRGLNTIGAETVEFLAPDMYQNNIAKSLVAINADDISLIVKPIELIRPCFGLRNIAICGWEFPEFSDISYRGDPRSNHVQMLRAVDSVWCWSAYTAKNLRRHGVEAQYLPPPVLLATDAFTESLDWVDCVSMDSVHLNEDCEPFKGILEKFDGKRYLTILNPFDKRKSFSRMLAAAAAEISDNDVLIVKLIIDNQGTRVTNINAILKIHHEFIASSKNIIFMGEYLSSSQMNQLYENCDYYLCCSSAEGLNLPLIDAMAKGLVAISTSRTAMGDYVSRGTAIVIPTKREPTGVGFHAASEYLQTTHFPPTISAVRAAIRRAKELSDDARKDMIVSAKNKVSDLYGIERFRKAVHHVFG